MIFKLMLKGLRTGKARFACAVAGVAVAVGTLVFMTSLKFLGQHGTMTAVGVAAGLPVGALVGWLFTFKTGAMWPGLPHYFVVPVRLVAEGALGALVFALVFAVPTALALVRRATRRQ